MACGEVLEHLEAEGVSTAGGLPLEEFLDDINIDPEDEFTSGVINITTMTNPIFRELTKKLKEGCNQGRTTMRGEQRFQ